MFRRKCLALACILFTTGCQTSDLAGNGSTVESPSMRLHIYNIADEKVEMQLILREEGGSTVYERTTVFAPGDHLTLDDSFEDGVDYEFSMKGGETTVFKTDIPSYRGIQLEITSKRDVVVANQVEI